MWTSNFKACGSHPNAVAISIGIPRGWRGRRYLPLAPTRAMLKMSSENYDRLYKQILAKLDPRQVYEELGPDTILLCWEKFNASCHRRLVGEWLEQSLGIIVPEFGHSREESVPYDQAAGKKHRAKIADDHR